MIAYFDTSAIMPLLVHEAGSALAAQMWREADRVVTVQVTYAEARAALAQAQRIGRVESRQLRALVRDLGEIDTHLDKIEIDEALVRQAGDQAERFALRGYDAVHLAALVRLDDPQAVMVSGDRDLCEAASQLGLPVCDTSIPR